MWRGKLALGGASLGPGHEGPHKLEPGQAEGAPAPQASPKEAAGVALVQAGPRNVCYAGAGARATPCVRCGAKPGTGLPLWADTSITTTYC